MADEVATGPSLEELKDGARTALVARAEQEYKIWCDVFDTADRKAQATTTVASALLAAALAFIAKVDIGSSLFFRGSFTVITVALAVCIGCALWAMKVRETATPPSTQDSDDAYRNLFSASSIEAFGQHSIQAHDKLLAEWIAANESVCKVGNLKADWVSRAQRGLAVAAIVTVAVVVTVIWNPLSLPLKNDSTTVVDQLQQGGASAPSSRGGSVPATSPMPPSATASSTAAPNP